MLPSEKLLFTRLEAAEMLSLSVSTLDTALCRGMLRVRRIGRRVMIEKREIEKFARIDHSAIWKNEGRRGSRGTRGASCIGRDCFDCNKGGQKTPAQRFYKNLSLCQGCWQRRSTLGPKKAAITREAATA